MVVQAVVDEGEGQYTLASCLHHSTFSWLSFPLKWASGCSELQSGQLQYPCMFYYKRTTLLAFQDTFFSLLIYRPGSVRFDWVQHPALGCVGLGPQYLL